MKEKNLDSVSETEIEEIDEENDCPEFKKTKMPVHEKHRVVMDSKAKTPAQHIGGSTKMENRRYLIKKSMFDHIITNIVMERNNVGNITKNQLKRIIREEIINANYDEKTEKIEDPLDQDLPEDVETKEDSWSGGQNLYQQIDHAKVSSGEETTRGVEVYKIRESKLRQMIRNRIIREAEERVVFDPEAVELPVPKKLVRLLDPDITPQKFAQFDAELDASGKPQEQAFACAAFALTYADNDIDQALKILKLAVAQLPKIGKGMEKAKEKES